MSSVETRYQLGFVRHYPRLVCEKCYEKRVVFYEPMVDQRPISSEPPGVALNRKNQRCRCCRQTFFGATEGRSSWSCPSWRCAFSRSAVRLVLDPLLGNAQPMKLLDHRFQVGCSPLAGDGGMVLRGDEDLTVKWFADAQRSLRGKGILIARTDEANPVAIRATRNQSQIIQRRTSSISSASLLSILPEAAP